MSKRLRILKSRPQTRDQDFSCLICQIGCLKLNEKKPLQKKKSSQEAARKRCADCLTLLSNGLPRVCKQSTLRENLELLITQDVDAAEQIASDLKAKMYATLGGTIEISQ